ncbi:MAG: DNA alkylation repair protein [bacterium]|nr:DNA alkylation repair protein [bacterium]
MSMNFGREMSLLRVRFTEAGSEERAAARKEETGSAARFLGATDEEVATAAAELVENYPQMGRAQMTAFVRTLWQSDVHELQSAAAQILAARAELLEPADFAFVEGLLKKCDVDALAERLADDALGQLVSKNKKVWRDLKKLAGHKDDRLKRAAIRACRRPVLADEGVFSRLTEIVEPILGGDDTELMAVVDELLAGVAAEHSGAVQELAERHGRKLQK